jgi:retron-type reverse transcriptase
VKTYKHLYKRIYAFENLYTAFRKARRGKRSRPDVAAFEFNLELELPRLQEELANETYRPGPYRHFTIYERKPRRISAAPFRDRSNCRVTARRSVPRREKTITARSRSPRPGMRSPTLRAGQMDAP